MKIMRNTEGFTLLEVVIAITILTIGLLGSAAMQLSSIQSNTKASNLTEATAQGQAQMETIQSWSYDDARLSDTNLIDYNRIGDQLIGAGPNILITTIGAQAEFFTQVDKYTIYVDATPDQPAVDSMNIRVDVVWTEETLLKTVSMNFVKTRF